MASSSDDSTPMTVATQQLRDVLRSRRLICREAGDWLRLGTVGLPSGPLIRARFETIRFEPDACSIQLDVEFMPWEGQRVLESCGGFGANVKAAEQEALARFAEGILPVLLAAFVHPLPDEVLTEQWEIAGVRRQVLLGRVQQRGEPASESATRAWLDAVKRALQALSLPTGTHWVRIFHAHQPEVPRTLELLLDNGPCAELDAALERAPWPRGPEATAQRLFLVIQGGVDVNRAVSSFIEHEGSEASVIVEELMLRGATPLEAEKLLVYLPQAFAQTLLDTKLPFPETLHLLSASRRGLWTMCLPEEPLWREALRRAEQCVSGEAPLTREQAISILRRYPGLETMLESMQSPDPGRRIKQISPLLVSVSDEAAAQLSAQRPADPIPARLAPFVSVLMGEDPASPREQLAKSPPARRPWWKFW